MKASSLLTPKSLPEEVRFPHNLEEVRAEKARRSLETYVREAWHAVEPETPFHSNWHVGAVCYHLEAITAGDIRNLVINIPPGFMKSLLATVFWPTWEWGPKGLPHLRYITASNGMALAVRDTKRSRDLILSEWYQRHYGSAFVLEGDQNQKTRYQNDRKGYRLAKSVGSGTGERGNRVIFDDPHELDDAYYPEALKTAVEYNNVTLDSRLADREKDAKIVVQQRVAKNDVTGDILRKMEEGGKQYEVLCLPMRHDPSYQMVVGARNKLGWEDPRTEPGELLDPERYSSDSVRVDEITYSQRAAAILDQNPKESAAAIFEREWWAGGRNRYRVDDPSREIVGRWLSLDLAMKDKEGNAFNALTVLEMTNPNYYCDVRDVWRGRESFPRLMPKIEDWALQWNYDGKLRGILIEEAARGYPVIETIQEGFDSWLNAIVIPVPPLANKLQRWHQAAAWCAVGAVRFPEPHPELSQMLPFEEELYELPNSTYKDWGDAFSQGVLHLEHLLSRGHEWRRSLGIVGYRQNGGA